MKKKRVLLIFNKYQSFGGEEVSFYNELNFLQNKNIVETLEFKNKNGLSVLWSSFNIISFFKTIYKIFIFRPDIVYINNLWFKASNSPLIACLFFRKLIINIKLHNYRLSCSNAIHYRNGKICNDCNINNKVKSYQHKCYKDSLILTFLVNIYSKIQFQILKSKKINHIYVLNNLQRSILEDFGIKKSKIFEVKNIVNLRKKSNFVNSNESNKFYFIGRLEEEKGLLDLISIWKNLKVHKFELHIIGEGKLVNFVQLQGEKYENIIFHGNLSNENVLKHLESSRALIFPTRLYEGQPTIILEALSCDTPIISPDIPFLNTYLKEDKILTYKLGDSKLLKNVIESYFEDSVYLNQKILWSKFKDNFFKNYPEFNLH